MATCVVRRQQGAKLTREDFPRTTLGTGLARTGTNTGTPWSMQACVGGRSSSPTCRSDILRYPPEKCLTPAAGRRRKKTAQHSCTTLSALASFGKQLST